MKRAPKRITPDEEKDANYFIQRAKNNLSSLMNRRKKIIQKHEKKKKYLSALEKNKRLREELKYLEMEYNYLLSIDFSLS